MAVVRARSAPPYALILFVALWLLSTGLFIWIFISKGSTDKELSDLQNETSAVYSKRTDTAAYSAYSPKEVRGNATVLGYLADQLRRAKDVNANDAHTIGDLRIEAAGLKSANDDLTKQLAQQQAQVADNKRNYDAAINVVNKSFDDVKTQLTSANAQAADLRNQIQALTEKSAKDVAAARDAAEADRREKVLQIEQLKQQLAAAQNKVEQLDELVKGLHQGPATGAGEADGVIVRSSIGTSEVYINLGQHDHIQPGQTFAVYDPKVGVRYGSDTEAQGKGGIEVVDVGPSQSLARITQQIKGQAITVGDLIANPVYHRDRSRQYHFVVVGDFDLDGDGVATAAEHDRLVRMIQSWGGIIDDQISSQTDYLVAGSRPATPFYDTGADTQGSTTDARKQNQLGFDDTIAEAKRNSVPILNANRFLAMIGYYNTTVVRY